MGKGKKKLKKKTRLVASSTAFNEPSTSGSRNDFATGAAADEPRVPPLPMPVRPPANPSEDEVMSNRQKKLLKSLQVQSERGGPSHSKGRVPDATLLASSRVPPIGDVPDVTSRLFTDPTLTTDGLLSIQNTRSVSSNLRSALFTNVRVTRSELQPPITPGNLRRQLRATSDADRSSTAEHSASTSPSHDFYLLEDSFLPSLVFTPTSEKDERDCGRSKQSHDTETASQSRRNKGVDKVTNARLLKIAGKFGYKKSDADLEIDPEEMDILARAIGGIQIEDEEIVSESPPQALSRISEISDSTPDNQTYAEKTNPELVSTEPHLTPDNQIVSEALENPEETAKDCEEMENVVKLASDVVDELTAQAEGICDRIIDGKLDSNSGLPDIPPDSILAINIVPIIDIVNSSAAELKTALGIDETAAVSDVGANDIGVTQSLKIVKSEADSPFTPDNEGVANEQQTASTQPRTAHSEVKSGDIPVEDGQSALSHSRKVPGPGKSDDGLQTQLDDSPGGAAAVGGSEKIGTGDLIPVAENKKILLDEKEKTILDDKMLTNLGDLQSQLEIAGNHEAGENASPELDLNTNPRPHRCSARLYCLEACRARSHLATCRKPYCEEKHCWPLIQVIAHWIHCVEKNCAVCPALGENDTETVREEAKWLNKETEVKVLRQHSEEQKAMSSELCDFLTCEGQHVILGYYVEYFFEVFVAYNVLREEAGLRASELTGVEIPQNLLETVRHSCNCLPLNDCRDNQCHQLRMVIAHWSKWSGLCYSAECRLCDRLFKRTKDEKTEISELLEFISGEMKPGQQDKLQAQLMQMVRKLDDAQRQEKKINLGWKDSSRMDFKNACVNSCMFADVEFGEMDGTAMETFDLASLFNKRSTYQLLVMSRYLIYKAITLREEQIFDGTINLATYFKKSMDQGVKMIRAVHSFLKEEISLFEDTWEDGNAIMNSCDIAQNKRYLMLMGYKMGNKMIEFADAMA